MNNALQQEALFRFYDVTAADESALRQRANSIPSTRLSRLESAILEHKRWPGGRHGTAESDIVQALRAGTVRLHFRLAQNSGTATLSAVDLAARPTFVDHVLLKTASGGRGGGGGGGHRSVCWRLALVMWAAKGRADLDGLADLVRAGFDCCGVRFRYLLSKDPADRVAYFLADDHDGTSTYPTAMALREAVADFHGQPTVARAGMRLGLLASGTHGAGEFALTVVTSPDIADGDDVCLTDGCGFVSADVAGQLPRCVSQGLVLPRQPGSLPACAFQVRLLGPTVGLYKGVLLVRKDLPPRTVVVRPSMLKVQPVRGAHDGDDAKENHRADGDWRCSALDRSVIDEETLRELSVVMRDAELRFMMKQHRRPPHAVATTHDVHIEVVNTAHTPASLRGTLNRHLLLLLTAPACGVPVGVFEDALRDEAAAVLRARTDRDAALALLADAAAPHLGTPPLTAAVDACTADPATAPTDAAALALQMLAAGHDLSEPFVQATLHGLVGRRVEAITDLRLPLAPAAYFMGVADPADTLAPDQVYVHHGRGSGGDGDAAFVGDGRGRDVVVARFPLMRTDAIGVFRSVANDALTRHFAGYAGGVVVFSTQPSGGQRTHPVVALGGDYDGDLYLVCADRRVVAAVADTRARLRDGTRPMQAPAATLPTVPTGPTDGDGGVHGGADRWAAQDTYAGGGAGDWAGDYSDYCDDDGGGDGDYGDYGGGDGGGDVPLVDAAVMPRSPTPPLPPAATTSTTSTTMTFDFTALAPGSPASSCDGATDARPPTPPPAAAAAAPSTHLLRYLDPLPPHARALLAAAPRSLTRDDFQAALCWEFFDAALAAGGAANVGRLANAWLAAADRWGPESPAAIALADAHDRALLARKHGGGGGGNDGRPAALPLPLDDVGCPHYMAAGSARRPAARHGAGQSYFSTSAVGRLHDLAQHLLQGAPRPSLQLPSPPPLPPPCVRTGRARTLVEDIASAGVRFDVDLRVAGASDFLELAQRVFDRLTADAAALALALAPHGGGTGRPGDHAARGPPLPPPPRARGGHRADAAARACVGDHVAALERRYRDVVCVDVVAELATKLGRDAGAVADALASALYEVAYLRAGERLAAAVRFAAADDARAGRTGGQYGDGVDRRRAAAMVASAAAAMKVCWTVCGRVLNAIKRQRVCARAPRDTATVTAKVPGAPVAVTAGALLAGLSEKRLKTAISLSFRPPPPPKHLKQQGST